MIEAREFFFTFSVKEVVEAIKAAHPSNMGIQAMPAVVSMEVKGKEAGNLCLSYVRRMTPVYEAKEA